MIAYLLSLRGTKQSHPISQPALKLRRSIFGDRLMVGLQVLVLAIGVRIPVPEQIKNTGIKPVFLILFEDWMGFEFIYRSNSVGRRVVS